MTEQPHSNQMRDRPLRGNVASLLTFWMARPKVRAKPGPPREAEEPAP